MKLAKAVVKALEDNDAKVSPHIPTLVPPSGGLEEVRCADQRKQG